MKWIPATAIKIEEQKTYHAKLPDAKTIGGTTTIDGTGRFQRSDGTFFWHEQGYVPIGKKEHHLLLILDETDDWIAVGQGNPELSKPYLVYDPKAVIKIYTAFCLPYSDSDTPYVFSNGGWCFNVTHYKTLPEPPSTPQGGNNKIK